MNSLDIRSKFLDFFKKYDHTIVPSSSLIPAEDPTLLFTNAGMNQFKDVFLGNEKRSYLRATSSQKCVRAGGKHNDLDEVGFTNRHLTFFEMLGNFSFGDYFKKEAIHYAWEFLTKDMGLDKETLCVSVFKTDDESYNIWEKEIGIPKKKIYKLGEEDNFWQMGDTGPCGPCSEIHVDKGPNVGCKTKSCDPSCSCGRFVEVWNLVFMQYDRQADGALKPLKQTGVDTGMGLERLSMIMQEKESIFHTDLFSFLIERIEKLTNKHYTACSPELQAAFHVLCDHVRSSCLLIADGCSPSNEGRGYVLRKIIRRAALFARKLTDDTSLFEKLGYTFIETMNPIFENLKSNRDLIGGVLKSEVERFAVSLEQGQQIFDKYVTQNKKQGKKTISGEQVFKLYDTYGFPPELTRVMAHDQGFDLDMEGFEVEMGKQRAQSGKKEKQKTDISIPSDIKTEFVGYDSLESRSKVLFAQYEDDTCWIVVEKAPFYVESGGQVGDTGFVTINKHSYKVESLQKSGDAIVIGLLVDKSAKKIKVGDVAHCAVDNFVRINAEKNHTATHILQAALTQVLGNHVKQSGSLVCGDYLRFDFTHHQAMTDDEIKQVEQIVNQKIQEDIELQISYTTLQEAQAAGATAFFGEKYDPECVRVVQVTGFSAELCGGTHVNRTGEIGYFKITSEAALATGTRRIIALTGPRAVEFAQNNFVVVKFLAEQYKVKFEGVLDAVEKERKKFLDLNRELKKIKKEFILTKIPKWAEDVEKIGVIPFWFASLTSFDLNELKMICQEMENHKPGVYCLVSSVGTDSYFIGYASKSFDVDLRLLSKELKDKCGFKGGGKPSLIQGGGFNVDVDTIKQCVTEWLKKV